MEFIKIYMRKCFKLLFVFLFFLAIANFAFAVDLGTPLGSAGIAMGQAASPEPGDLPQKVGGILKIFIGTLSIVLAGYVVYGGYLWMSAGGDSDQVKKAKQHITNAIIGLVICLFAYAITSFVVSNLSAEVLGGK